MSREQWVDERRRELCLSWGELERRSGVSSMTLKKYRNDENNYLSTIRRIEQALGWAPGSTKAIDEGRTPTIDIAINHQTSEDPADQLRDIRTRVGAIAFRMLVELISEES